jgi:hypothetical protein
LRAAGAGTIERGGAGVRDTVEYIVAEIFATAIDGVSGCVTTTGEIAD